MPSVASPIQTSDPYQLEELNETECWRLVSTQVIGRVAVILGHYPLVFPVNYTVDDRTIRYCTGIGTKLQALHRSNVTFEVDQIDATVQSGWSVMVKGVAQLVPDGDRPLISPTPWAPGDRTLSIRIICDEISGRRIHRADV